MEREKLIEAAKMLKKHCDDTRDCHNCVFYQKIYDVMECSLSVDVFHEKDFPRDWILPEVQDDE